MTEKIKYTITLSPRLLLIWFNTENAHEFMCKLNESGENTKYILNSVHQIIVAIAFHTESTPEVQIN